MTVEKQDTKAESGAQIGNKQSVSLVSRSKLHGECHCNQQTAYQLCYHLCSCPRVVTCHVVTLEGK